MHRVVSYAALMLLAMSSQAAATVFLPATFADVVNGSELVVRGTVIEVRSEQTASRRSIYTIVTVDVAETLKGSAVRAVSFRIPSGQVGRYRRIVVGSPEFVVGDEAVLFLNASPPSIPVLFGLSQGVYRVSRVSGRPLVMPPVSTAASDRVARGDPSRRPLRLDAFADAVRDVRSAR